MRIALYHNLTSGGSKREAYEFAKELIQNGHIVDLFCPVTANEQFLPLANIVSHTSIFDLSLASNWNGRLPLMRGYIDLLTLMTNLRRLDRLAVEIARQIDAANYDLAFVHHDRIVQSPYLLKHLRTPSVYYCAEPMREFYEPPIFRSYQNPATRIERVQRHWYAPARAVKRHLVKSSDAKNVQRASLLVTNSFFTVESIYRAYALRARVVYLGVDTTKFRSLNMERQNFVLSVGAISSLKGYDFLIEALSLVPAQQRPRLVIAGNTASIGETQFLRTLAERQGVSLEVCLDVSDDDLVALYNRARAFVYSPVLEPFGFAPLEAMSCGTPVVAVKEGGVRESVIDGMTGFLVPRDPKVFAEALGRVLGDTGLANNMERNGRAEILRFWTWPLACDRLLANVDSLAKQNKA